MRLLEKEYVHSSFSCLRQYRGEFPAFGAIYVVGRDSDRYLTWVSKGGVEFGFRARQGFSVSRVLDYRGGYDSGVFWVEEEEEARRAVETGSRPIFLCG